MSDKFICLKEIESYQKGERVEVQPIHANADYLPENYIAKYVINGKDIQDEIFLNTYFKKLK